MSAAYFRFCLFAIMLLISLGLFVSYRFDMDVRVAVNLVQQYTFQNRFSQQLSSEDILGNKSENLEIGQPSNWNDKTGRKIKLNGTNPTIQSSVTLTGNGIKNRTDDVMCKFPQLLVDDPIVKPYLQEYGPLNCSEEKNWVYTSNGRFYIDPDAVKRHGEISCKYWRYDRPIEDDFIEKAFGAILNDTPLNGDSFYYRCTGTNGSQYDNLHIGVPIPDPESDLVNRIERGRKLREQNPDKGLNMNVFIYLMDSVSRINFVRKLPKSYKVLTEMMGAYVMEGFNIVGDGTPWAVIPMLTGHFQTELPEARRRFDNASFVDSWPFVFKNFTRAGYVTSFAEELPWFNALTYKLKGFDRQPVDHYLKPFLMAMETYRDEHKPYCLGDTPRSLLWLKFWRELQDVYRPLGGKQFSVLFSAETSHDDYNYVQTLDEHWAREFEKLYKEDYLNDTIFIVMGDHGRRFGEFRQTQTGKLEEKLPFLAVIVPPAFREKFPRSIQNLKLNRDRLVTVFDLHETFMDVLNSRQDGGVGNLSQRGISLLKEVPAARTCAHADIKAHFCSCLDWEEVKDLTNDTVINASNTVIGYFNKKSAEANGKCAELKLGKMISARLLKPNDRLMAFKESLDFDNYTPNLSADKELQTVLYQIRFTTEPGGGDWEASLTYFMNLDTFGMSFDDISRLNAYGEQAKCVIDTHQHLRTFCYCNN